MTTAQSPFSFHWTRRRIASTLAFALPIDVMKTA
jgi:hypothetical protein